MTEHEQHRARAERHRHDAALADLLRMTDPAKGARLDAVERANMRSAVTAAAGSRAEGTSSSTGRSWHRPALAAALVAAFALALWVSNGPSTTPPSPVADAGSPPPVIADDSPGVAGDSSGVTGDSSGAADSSAATSAPAEAIAEAPTTITAAATPTPPARTAGAAAGRASPSDRRPRTLQFTAPRGTRIIWTLDPNFESPITGQENTP